MRMVTLVEKIKLISQRLTRSKSGGERGELRKDERNWGRNSKATGHYPVDSAPLSSIIC